MKLKRAVKVWVVLHGEIHLTLQGPRVDETVTYTATSKASALRLMRKTSIEPGTWWLLESAPLDRASGMGRIPTLYSRSLRPISGRPYATGERAAVSRLKREISRIEESLQSGRPGKTRLRAILRRTLKDMRRLLKCGYVRGAGSSRR